MRKNINISPIIFLGALCIICLALAVHCARADTMTTGENKGWPTGVSVGTAQDEHSSGVQLTTPTPRNLILPTQPTFHFIQQQPRSYISAGITRGNVALHYEEKKFLEVAGLHADLRPLGEQTSAWPKYQPPEKPEEITVELITKDGTTYTAQWVKKEPK